MPPGSRSPRLLRSPSSTSPTNMTVDGHRLSKSAAENRSGRRAKIPYVENVPEVAGKIKPAAETFISRGYNVIIGTAFGYSDTFKELAEKYPKVAFLNASGTTNGPNLHPFMDALTKASIFAAWWPVQCPRPANSASLQRIRSVR